jgi:[ribosomal protein S5]-alanine N-acetyltransferase
MFTENRQKSVIFGRTLLEYGIMTKAINLICDYGFKNLDIIRIHAGIFEFNPASMRVLEKCGFKREAVCKKAIIKQGMIYDEVRYAKLID